MNSPFFAAPPRGLLNTGNLCWLNSATQALMSIPKIAAHNSTNSLAAMYATGDMSVVAAELAAAGLINAGSQDSAGAGFRWLVDKYKLGPLFQLQHSIHMACTKCRKVIDTIATDTAAIWKNCEVSASNVHELVMETWGEYECSCMTAPNCSTLSTRPNDSLDGPSGAAAIWRLRSLSEVYAVELDVTTRTKDVPLQITVIRANDANHNHIRFRLMAVVFHSGYYDPRSHNSGGHYFAAVRRNNAWWEANDNYVVEQSFDAISTRGRPVLLLFARE